MDEITTVFVTESREQLATLESALLQLENSPDDDDTLNAIFRSAHTIKGGAAVIECGYIVAFTHVVENVLDKLRNREIKLDSDLIALLLAADSSTPRAKGCSPACSATGCRRRRPTRARGRQAPCRHRSRAAVAAWSKPIAGIFRCASAPTC